MKPLSPGAQVCCLLGIGCFSLSAVSFVYARQNVFIGEISVRYDHNERSYDQTGPAPVRSTTQVDQAEGTLGDVTSPVVTTVIDDRRGDRQSYIVAPRLTFTTTGISDVLELTYAPGLNYDHLYETTDLDHDFGLRLEKDITRVWHVSLNNRYFLGDDPARETGYRTAPETMDGQGTVVDPPAVVGTPVEGSNQELSDVFGRRRYWTNTLDFFTDYEFGDDRSVSAGYTFDVLRNEDVAASQGYTDYDRHVVVLGLQHRLNRRWYAETEASYTRGLYDEPGRNNVGLSTTNSALSGSSIADQGGTPDVSVQDQGTSTGANDFAEYSLRFRGEYATTPHLNWFSEYTYRKTSYDESQRAEYTLKDVALGINYDVSSHLHCTLSGGPSWGAFDGGSSEMDYNAYAGLTWRFQHGEATFSAEKGYRNDNFDGRISGLTDFWSVGFSLDYQLTSALNATIFSSFVDNDRLQSAVTDTQGLAVTNPNTNISLAESLSEVMYSEQDYDVGMSLEYVFQRWYSVVAGYSYILHDSDQYEYDIASYDEHRFFIELVFNKEIFRW